MFVWKHFKFREADFADIFIEYPARNFSDGKWIHYKCQRIKERVVFFKYKNGILSGPFKTSSMIDCPDVFYELYVSFVQREIMLLEPRQIAQEAFSKKVWFRPANFDDIERNTIFFEYNKVDLLGPWTLPYDLSDNDVFIVQKLNQKRLYVVNETQEFG